MKNIISFLILISLFTYIFSADVPFTNCGQPEDLMQIDSITADTWPPKKDKPITTETIGSLKEEIQGGTCNQVVKFYGVVALNETFDICTIPDFKCPHPVGSIDWKSEIKVPAGGKYDVEMTATDTNSKGLFCLKMSFNV